jgi:hypothetical protein
VAGELLDDGDVGALRQEVRDAAPAEIVWSKRFHTSFAAVFLQNVPDPLATQTAKADAAGLIHVAE